MIKLNRTKKLYTFCLIIFPGFLQAESLLEAISVAIETNPAVLASVNQHSATVEEIKQARAGYLPTADVAIGTGWEMTDNPSTSSQGRGEVHFNRDEASLQVRQMLFDGMETTSQVNRTTSKANAQSYSTLSLSEDTALRAVEAYLNVLRRQHLVELANTNLETHERTHDQIKLRSEHGVSRKADLEQSTGRLALARTNLIAEQSNLFDSEAIYLNIVGIPANDLTDPEFPQFQIPETVDDAIAQALDNHPVLKSAEADIEVANAQYDVANARFFPRVDLDLRASADHNIDGVAGTNKDITAMVRLRYNLFSGGRDSARREETAFLINQAAEVRNNTHREVEQNMRLAWNALQAVNSQLEYFAIHVEASERSRDAYQQQFNLGQRTLLDLLDAENELFVARQDKVNAKYDQLFAMYRIANGMGKLLPTLHIAQPEVKQH